MTTYLEVVPPPTAQTTIAVLLGASEYPQKPSWTNPVLGESARAFRAYLLSRAGLALPPAQLLDLFDCAAGPVEQLFQIKRFLETPGAAARDLLVYYVGHGGFDNEDYYLGIHSTQCDHEFITTIESNKLARIIRRGFRARRIYVILDACFSASAAADWQGNELEAAIRKLARPLPRRGTVFLSAASKYDVARAPRTERFTIFTGAVLEVLTRGIDGGGPDISMSELYEAVREITERRGSGGEGRPELHVPDQRGGDISQLGLFPNAAYHAARDGVVRFVDTGRVTTPVRSPVGAADAAWCGPAEPPEPAAPGALDALAARPPRTTASGARGERAVDGEVDASPAASWGGRPATATDVPVDPRRLRLSGATPRVAAATFAAVTMVLLAIPRVQAIVGRDGSGVTSRGHEAGPGSVRAPRSEQPVAGVVRVADAPSATTPEDPTRIVPNHDDAPRPPNAAPRPVADARPEALQEPGVMRAPTQWERQAAIRDDVRWMAEHCAYPPGRTGAYIELADTARARYCNATRAFWYAGKDALELARRAAAPEGPYRIYAMLLVADTLYQQRDLYRARTTYEAVLETTSDADYLRDEHARAESGIRRCDRTLADEQRNTVEAP